MTFKYIISVLIINTIAIILYFISVKTTYYNVLHLFRIDIIKCYISKVKLESSHSKGGNIYAYEFECENLNNKNFLTPYEREYYNLNIGDTILLKSLYAGNTNSKILYINDNKINNYYGFFDLFMVLFFVLIPYSYFLYFKISKKSKYIN